MRDGSHKVAGVVLAAGKSSRMGEFKPVMEMGGKAMLQRVIENAKEGELEPVIVVTGYARERVKEIISRSGAREVHNPDFEEGMLSSVQIGVRAVGDAAGFMVILGDQPGVRADTYIEVCQEWRRSGAKV